MSSEERERDTTNSPITAVNEPGHTYASVTDKIASIVLTRQTPRGWFREGNHFKLYEKLGSHEMTAEGVEGACFAVWAPNAAKVSVIR